MNCAVLCIGTELTRGELVNTNAAWLSERLTAEGFTVLETVVVDDDVPRIERVLRRLGREVSFVVCTGGLGPTTDDLTAIAVAKVLGVQLVRDEASLEHIRARFRRLGRPMSPTNEKQADLPQGATVLANELGSAPGFQVRIGESEACFLPGVPREMKPMFEQEILPRFASRVQRTSYQLRYRTFGLPESTLGERLAGVEEAFPGVIIGYRAHFPEVEVKVLASGKDQAAARAQAEAAAADVTARLGEYVYGAGEDSFSGVVLRELVSRKQTVALAESCTGGLASSQLTAHAGASAAVLGGVVAYANSVKVGVLQVDAGLIERVGAVSEEVARAMAENVRRITSADIGLGITGIAGPDGGTADKPVGTVFIAVATKNGSRVERCAFPWHRAFVQQISAHMGLKLIREASQSLAAPAG